VNTKQLHSVTDCASGDPAPGATTPELPGYRMIMKRGGSDMTHFVSTAATEKPCPRCRTAVLIALDEGVPARADAQPLADRQAEIAAILNGLWTYTLIGNRELVHRDASRIQDRTLRGTVHAEHKCAGRIQLTIDDLINPNPEPKRTSNQ
jgi:hypothetical protein